MKENGVRRFLLVHTPQEGSFGIWVNEADQVIQYPKALADWKLAPLAELRVVLRKAGCTLEETGKRM